MRKFRLLILLGLFIGSCQIIRTQVFAHPGATWMFHRSPFVGFCSGSYQKWEYVGDTLLGGENANRISVEDNWNYAWDTTAYATSHYNCFFHTSGDTVFLWHPSNHVWVELYNFSLGIGDSTHSPLKNPLLHDCADTVPYHIKAVVTNAGTTTIAGQNLRYYTVYYRTGIDTNHATQTYYERIITLDSWYPNDPYNCGATDGCSPAYLQCYKDSGMMTDSLCADLTWFEVMSIPQEPEPAANISIYPNPATQVLIVSNDPNPVEKYSIIGSDGKQILTNIQSPINVFNLPSGVYIITNEARTWYKKFVKN